MFKTVLWATDGSTAAERALPVATSVAQTYGAKLIVVHAGVQASGVPLAAPAAIATAQKSADAIEEALRRKVEDLKREGFDVVLQASRVWMGGAAHVIAEIAKQEGADLITAGTRGHGPLSGLLLGSVTHRLVQIAHWPVASRPYDVGGYPRQRHGTRATLHSTPMDPRR